MYKRSSPLKKKKKAKPKDVVRSNRINEAYYAMDNCPSYRQFKGYHFYDEKGRLYTIADKNNEVFQNERLRYDKRQEGNERRLYQTSPLKRKECVVDSSGFIKLFVRLSNSSLAWFNTASIDKTLYVKERRSHENISFKLRSTFKFNPKRLTGIIHVSNLNRSYCNRLLNE